jgi:hypothetical protein
MEEKFAFSKVFCGKCALKEKGGKKPLFLSPARALPQGVYAVIIISILTRNIFIEAGTKMFEAIIA